MGENTGMRRIKITLGWPCEDCGAEIELVLDAGAPPSVERRARCPGCGRFGNVGWPELEALRRFVDRHRTD